MRIVIVGAQSREELDCEWIVNQILNDCIERYGKFLIITTFCGRGVGKVIKSRNIDPLTHRSKEFDMLEITPRFWLTQSELGKPEFISIHNALNSMLVEAGDEFYILTEEKPKTTMLDLRDKIIEAGRPFVTYKPAESTAGSQLKRPTPYTTTAG